MSSKKDRVCVKRREDDETVEKEKEARIILYRDIANSILNDNSFLFDFRKN